ncbi:MAG: FAD-dependent monooxygenase [Bacteroidia bacterium]
MINNKEAEISIIGGGIAGLAAAIGFKKAGIKVSVFESAKECKPVGAGLMLAINAIKALDSIGVMNGVCAAAKPIQSLQILTKKGHELSKSESSPVVGKNGSVYKNHAIHRADLHKVLLNELSNNTVKWGKKLSLVQRVGNSYKMHFEDGTTATSKFIISAEGIHSKIREFVNPNSKKRYAGYTCWRGIAKNMGASLNSTSETWGNCGRFGIVPLTNNRVYWFAVVNAQQNSPIMRQWTLNDLKANFRDYHSRVLDVLGNTNEKDMLWNDIIDLKPIKQYAFNNILLIGDSAHATTPNMGQGACMAIEDAATLYKCLITNDSYYDAFKAFEQKRLARTHQIVNSSWRIGKMAQNQNPILGMLRNSLTKLTPNTIMQKQMEHLYNVEF